MVNMGARLRQIALLQKYWPPPLVAAGLLLAVVGLTALTGWQLGMSELQTFHSGTQMAPLSATLFVLIGCGLITLYLERNLYTRAISVLVMIVGLAILGRISFGWPFYPERILFPSLTNTSSISLNLALNYSLSGAILLISSTGWRWRRTSVRILSVFVAMLSLLALVGYLFGVTAASGTLSIIPMAVHAALSFLIVASTLLLYNEQLQLGHVRRSVLGLFGILTLVTVFSNALAYQSVQRLITAQTDLKNRVELQATLDQLIGSTLDAQTNERGYLLTGASSDLDRYRVAAAQIELNLNTLHGLSSGRKELMAGMQQLNASATKEEAALAQVVALEQGGQPEAALDLVRGGQGREEEIQLRKIVAKLHADETMGYNKTLSSAHQTIARTTGVVIGASALNIILIAVVLQLIFSEAAERYERQREVEEALAAVSEQKAKDVALLSSIGDGVFAIDNKGRIVLFNKAAADITGFSEAEALGRYYHDVLSFRYVDSGRASNRFINRALQGFRAKMSNHTVVKHKDGQDIPVADSAAPVMNSAGLVAGAIIVFRDITNEYAIERAKDEFVALASHQLRTPATGVKQYLSMVLDGYGGKINAKARDMVVRAYASNERQLHTLQDMLDAASVEAGRIALETTRTNLSAMLRDIAQENKSLIGERQQKLTLNLGKAAIQATVDPRRIRMAIENLINNASKYTLPGGLIEVTASITTNQIFIAVRDNGVGIAKTDLPHIFNKFIRIQNTLSSDVRGSGLGLYVAHRIITLHKGKITVNSRLGHGSTFTIIIPI